MNKGGDGIFHDIQEFEEISTGFALSSNLLQVDKGVPTIRHDCIDLGDLMLRRLKISHALIDGFRIRDGWTTFVFTPTRDANALWNGVPGLPDAIGIVRSEMDHEVLMPAGWSTIEIDVADRLIDIEGMLPERVYAGAMLPEKGQLRLSATMAFTVRRDLLALFDQDALSTTAVLAGEPALDLRRQILDQLAVAAEAGCHEVTAHPVSPSNHERRRVRQAREMLESNLMGNPTIESIAYELGVTTRSLQRSFLTILGMSPKQYYMARKLDAARRAMRRRGQLTNVIDIAHEFGFVSASRFSEQYYRHFGHTPSTAVRFVTLK